MIQVQGLLFMVYALLSHVDGMCQHQASSHSDKNVRSGACEAQMVYMPHKAMHRILVRYVL